MYVFFPTLVLLLIHILTQVNRKCKQCRQGCGFEKTPGAGDTPGWKLRDKDEIVTVNNGRYGPYIKFSTKSISIPNDLDPHSVEISKAIELIDEKLKAEEPVHIYNEIPVTKGKGRFGPFIKWNDMFINVNKSYDFDNLSINEIEELIELKIKKEKEKLISHWTDEDIKVEKGRWGRSIISKGKKKVEIPKEIDPKTITLEIAKQYLNPKKKK